jgi:hypothetical protein
MEGLDPEPYPELDRTNNYGSGKPTRTTYVSGAGTLKNTISRYCLCYGILFVDVKPSFAMPVSDRISLFLGSG